jgi:catechol 2,3-dioxygenase-like lactoylglutathione lyase family enzyme
MSFRDPQINYYVQDVEAAVSFYTGHFGFVESFRTPKTGVPEHVEVRLGGLVLGLASIASARDVHGLDVGGDRAKAEIVLWTDDTDAEYEKLIAAGVKSLSPPHTFLGRLRAAWLEDLDGNPVEIVANYTTSSESE